VSATIELVVATSPADFLGARVLERLATASIGAARELGYSRMVLDTLGTMTAARALYADLGFVTASPYYANPGDDVKFLELTL
jgi:putative acetyltransferase